MELLNIISNALQFFLSAIILSFVFILVIVKLKSNNKKVNSSKESECKMNNQIYSVNKTNPSILPAKNTPNHEVKKQIQIKPKIFEIYNPDNNPHFYMRNKLNWYKNFD